MSEQKYCILKADLNPITITLKVDSDITAGSDFKLFDPKTQKVYESFKLNSLPEKPGAFKFKTKANYLHKLKMNFMIVVCSKNPNNFRGSVALEILQSGRSVKLTSPLSWLLKNIPPCSYGNTEKIKSSIFFVINKGQELNPFTGLPQNQ